MRGGAEQLLLLNLNDVAPRRPLGRSTSVLRHLLSQDKAQDGPLATQNCMRLRRPMLLYLCRFYCHIMIKEFIILVCA